MGVIKIMYGHSGTVAYLVKNEPDKVKHLGALRVAIPFLETYEKNGKYQNYDRALIACIERENLPNDIVILSGNNGGIGRSVGIANSVLRRTSIDLLIKYYPEIANIQIHHWNIYTKLNDVPVNDEDEGIRLINCHTKEELSWYKWYSEKIESSR